MVAKPQKAGKASGGTSQKKAKSVTGKRGGKAPRKVAVPKKESPKNRSASPKKAVKAAAKKKNAKPRPQATKSSVAKRKIGAGKKSTATASRKATPAKSSLRKKVDEQAIADFKALVNLTRKRLETWLDTDESRKVGLKYRGKGESAGHESGKKIVELIGKRRDRFSDDDVKHIHKVVDDIKRHLAQRPKGDITASNWRYSLMNWGHDPAK